MSQPASVFFDAVFVHNVVLVYFLGLCPFLGVSKTRSAAWGMGLATTVVLIVATLAGYVLERFLLEPFGLGYLRIVGFILVIAAAVQFLELFMKRAMPALHQALGIYLPLITTNCAVLGAALINSTEEAGLAESVLRGAGSGVGFLLAIVVYASLRQRLARAAIPAAFRGTPVALVSAGILSLLVMGFAGLGA